MKEKLNRLISKILRWRLHRPDSTKPTRLSSQITITLDPVAQAGIQELMDRTEHRNFFKLMKKTLATYYVLVEHVSEGGKVVLRHKDGKEDTFDPISVKAEDPEE